MNTRNEVKLPSTGANPSRRSCRHELLLNETVPATTAQASALQEPKLPRLAGD